tara:strand:+ start:85 stop:399 length:315 start_codon:yes stop_codon:yes gene_type:complete
MTNTNTSYQNYAETEDERNLREYATLPNFKRPSSEHFIEYFYEYVHAGKNPDMNMLPHSDLFYVRATLEDKFPDRLFTMEEIRTLMDQEFKVKYPSPEKNKKYR